MRIVKWVLAAWPRLVVILGLAWVMVPKDRIINFALDRVEAQTGRDISVGGDAELKIFRIWLVGSGQCCERRLVRSRGNDVRGPFGCFGVYGGAFGGDIVISRLSLIRPDHPVGTQ